MDYTENKKQCSLCKEIKMLSEFYKRPGRAEHSVQHICKTCSKTRTKEQRIKNPSASRKAAKKWGDNHIEKKKEILRKWQAEHPERVKELRKKVKAKKVSTPWGKLNRNIATKMRASLNGRKGGKHWESLVGYTVEQLKIHLEKQFKPGMNWDNYGKWHVDHKIPIAAHNFESAKNIDFKKCWELKNLQPLWAKENIIKSDKLNKPFQPSLTI